MQQGATALAGWPDQRPVPLVVAHRGAWRAAPQNSLQALEDAVALGCAGIEIDVRRTADDRLVVVHDARVGLRAVGSLKHHEVQARLKSGQAPLLDTMLERAAGRIMVDIELKEDGYVAEVMRTVRRHLGPRQYVVTSFRPAVLAQVAALAPEARTGLLLAPGRHRDLESRLARARAGFLAPHISLARTGMFQWAAAHGLALWVWTVNERRLLRAAFDDPRVEAVVTDEPERALHLAGPISPARAQGL